MRSEKANRFIVRFMVLALVVAIAALPVSAATPTKAEIKQAHEWCTARFSDKPSAALPFSFIYDGKPSAELLKTWKTDHKSTRLDKARVEHTITYTDKAGGLLVTCKAVEYRDFPMVEWTLYFKNTGDKDTPILEKVQGLDTTFQRGNESEFVLSGIKGDWCTADSYEPYSTTLGPKATEAFAPAGGRPTNGPKGWPYFNIQMPGSGVILAVGWPGQWAASFTRDDQTGLRVTAGQELTRLTLKPGEEIRSPLIALLFWQGRDVADSQNVWRRWMLAHNLPRPGGQPLKPMYVFCSGGFFENYKVSEASEKLFIDTLTKEGIALDYWWIDAGWYACNSWTETGTWEFDKERFPKGIKAVSNYVHAKGTKMILWFEPERVAENTWIAKNHPDWIFGGDKGGLLNLGDPDARKWLIDHIDRFITEQGIDLYRQDYNIDPLGFWRGNDTADRQGITENKYVCGYLAYWDELIRRHPGMLIDSCASGGRRNDLETLRRAVPLLRSDYQSFAGDPAYIPGNQGQTYGLSMWFPFYGTGVYYTPTRTAENVRSHTCPSFGICVDVRKKGVDWDMYRRLVAQWRQMAPSMLGDYYPLTPYSLADDRWIAWQFNLPEKAEGMIQAFRRDKNNDASQVYKLRGLDRRADYAVEDLDSGQTQLLKGAKLMDEGLKIDIAEQPGSALIVYRKK